MFSHRKTLKWPMDWMGWNGMGVTGSVGHGAWRKALGTIELLGGNQICV